jgi:hypothetical protein
LSVSERVKHTTEPIKICGDFASRARAGYYDILHGQQLFDPLKCIVWKKTLKVRRRDVVSLASARIVESAMTTPEMDNENIVRLIDIIGDGDLTAEAQEQLHLEGLWPLYESLRQTAYAAFVFGHRNG